VAKHSSLEESLDIDIRSVALAYSNCFSYSHWFFSEQGTSSPRCLPTQLAEALVSINEMDLFVSRSSSAARGTEIELLHSN